MFPLVDRATAGRPYLLFHRKLWRVQIYCALCVPALGEFVSATDSGFEQLRRNIFRAAEHFGEDRHLRRFLDDQIGAGCRGGIRAERQHAVIFQQHGFGIFRRAQSIGDVRYRFSGTARPIFGERDAIGHLRAHQRFVGTTDRAARQRKTRRVGRVSVDHRAGVGPLFVHDRVHVHDLGVGRIDLAFNQLAVEIEDGEIFRFQIVEGAGGR